MELMTLDSSALLRSSMQQVSTHNRALVLGLHTTIEYPLVADALANFIHPLPPTPFPRS